MRPPEPLSIALDLGSTYVKAGRLEADGCLTAVHAEAAPALRGSGLIREGSAIDYLTVADRVLRTVIGGLSPGVPLGVATQRSTFVVWDRERGRPLMPMISWQDRRGAEWCSRHPELEAEIVSRTGLISSGHYMGPKLAVLSASTRQLAGEQVCCGTLDSYLVWNGTPGRDHVTDVTVAARTLMMDLDGDDWSPFLLDCFGVPRRALPRIGPSCGRDHRLDLGPRLTASVSDQAAGALAVLSPGSDDVLVTLGTGAFVMRAVATGEPRRTGYLRAPVLAPPTGERRFVDEGPINGAGAALDRFGPAAGPLPASDPAPEAFCLPDAAGLGAPYWVATHDLTFSDEAEALDVIDRRRVVVEGLLFRIRQVIDDLAGERPPRRLLLSGGLTRDPAIVGGLAALLDRDVELLDEQEGGLIGVARLAAGLEPFADPPTTAVAPADAGHYLGPKYRRWRDWLDALLSRR